MSSDYQSWGRYPRVRTTNVAQPYAAEDVLLSATDPVTPYGLGRSYGDVCLSSSGNVLDCRQLDHVSSFDRQTGLLRAEAGVSLREILQTTVPRGWILPVIPGTQHVTLGGAIANDVHGKNQPLTGAFGNILESITLRRTEGFVSCSRFENPELFRATVGGLGLTGVITEATVRLRPVQSAWMTAQDTACANIDDILTTMDGAPERFEYSAAWVDLLSRGQNFGRGIVSQANHEKDGLMDPEWSKPLPVPFVPPVRAVNAPLMRVYNALRFRRESQNDAPYRKKLEPFFFPLDGLAHWNRLYGPRGFLQFQCTIPRSATPRLLQTIERSSLRPFLCVLKVFGAHATEGMLSYTCAGDCWAFDFPNVSAVFPLLERLDAVVTESGGRHYLAKDGRLSAAAFQATYPQWRELLPFKDPGVSNALWERVTSNIQDPRSKTTVGT